MIEGFPERLLESNFKVPVLIWLPAGEIEEGAMQQLRNAATHPEVIDHVAVMPDVHQGYGIPVGSIMRTQGSVIPNAVGVDIGCGVAAYATTLNAEELGSRNFWRQWSGQVGRDVPTGFSSHRSPQRLGNLERALRATELQPLLREKAAFQIGTLGGGNHFLEAAVDERGEVWLLAHSGSRHTGLRIAGHYHDLAKARRSVRGLDTVDDLASLQIDDESGTDYLHDMQWAAQFAAENRFRMVSAMGHALGIEIDRSNLIEVPHNLAWVDGDVVTHRKGATPARLGQLGVIPGSMGASSYIVRGLGNQESFESCSHGAGRQMSRGAARKSITEAEFTQSLAGTYSRPSMRYVDEAPGAYKDIDLVIERQRDLIEVVHKLSPIITLKGDSRARED